MHNFGGISLARPRTSQNLKKLALRLFIQYHKKIGHHLTFVFAGR